MGAVYGLERSIKLGFTSDVMIIDCEQYNKDLIKAAEEIASGSLESIVWSSGFYFNSTLQRVAAGYERILKVIYKSDVHKDNIEKAISNGLLSVAEDSLLKCIRGEVDKLKHNNSYGLLKKRTVEMNYLKEAISILIRVYKKAAISETHSA